MLKNSRSNHLNMKPAAAQQLMIAYLYPRPVVLVSVDTPDHRNIFPMDLIGPLERSGLFSLALRSTNVSRPVMCETRRVALSSMPASMKATVYTMAEHHKQPLQAWNELPFPIHPSREFAIPAVAEASRVRELAIVHSQEIGIHTLFLCRIISDDTLTDAAQLHHTAGFHQTYRRKQGMPFTDI
jgi:flavin reductase (DIM6/NTAB) family NADH-FMN oxidoreductase RutF